MFRLANQQVMKLARQRSRDSSTLQMFFKQASAYVEENQISNRSTALAELEGFLHGKCHKPHAYGRRQRQGLDSE